MVMIQASKWMFGRPEGERYFIFIKMEVLKGLDHVRGKKGNICSSQNFNIHWEGYLRTCQACSFRQRLCQLRMSLGMELTQIPQLCSTRWSDTVRSVHVEASTLLIRPAQLLLASLTHKERRCYLVSSFVWGTSLSHLAATPHSEIQMNSHSGLV